MRINRPLVRPNFFEAPFEVKSTSKEMKVESSRG